MATVNDAPPELRALARKIPPDTIKHLGRAELLARLEKVQGLLDEASYSDEREAKRLRHDADRYLSAVSFRAYTMTMTLLSGELEAARLRGDALAERQLGDKMAEFAERHPQPVLEMAANGEDVSAILAEITQTGARTRPPKRPWYRRSR